MSLSRLNCYVRFKIREQQRNEAETATTAPEAEKIILADDETAGNNCRVK